MLCIRIALAAALIAAAAGSAMAQQPQPEQPAEIGFPSVAAALEGMRAKPGVTVLLQDGWTIINDTGPTIWSFTPPAHPAHPSAARRALVSKDGQMFVETRIKCEASKPACDKLRDDYAALDKRMIEELSRSRK
jgi:hypothetical protein